jgi:hypothetical protein
MVDNNDGSPITFESDQTRTDESSKEQTQTEEKLTKDKAADDPSKVKTKPKRPRSLKKKPQAQKLEIIPGVLNMADLARLPDLEWAIHGLVQRVGVSIIHGAPGTLKTFFALHMAGCLAYGMPFVPDGPKCRRGLVLYVAFEGLRAFKQRRRAWLKLHRLPEPDHDALKLINPRKEKLEDIDGIDFDFSEESKARNLIGCGKSLSAREGLPVVAVFVDVLKESLKNGVESVKTFTQAAQYARMIADELQCQVIIIHHNTSNSDQMRGPKSLEGHIETRIAVKRNGNFIGAFWAKNREGLSLFTMVLRAHKMTLGVDKEGEEINSLAIETLGIDEDGSMAADDTGSKLREIAVEMTDGEELLMAPLLRRLGWSEDGRGGRQRGWVRQAIGDATQEKPRLVHLSGETYKHLWIRKDRGREIVCCRQLTTEEVKLEQEEQKRRLEELAAQIKGKRAAKDNPPLAQG